MTTNKLTDREVKLITTCVILVITSIALLIGLVVVSNESAKYNAILEMACNYTYDKAGCKQGMKLLKSMPIEEIKDLGK